MIKNIPFFQWKIELYFSNKTKGNIFMSGEATHENNTFGLHTVVESYMLIDKMKNEVTVLPF